MNKLSFNHKTFEPLMSIKSITLFHDSIQSYESNIYGEDKRYQYSVNEYMKELREEGYNVLDLPFQFGLSLVIKKKLWKL
jgi:hypothetical protein